MIKNTVLFILSLLIINGVIAQNQEHYKIDIKIKNSNDSVLYLANYYGDKTYMADTAFVKGKGNFVFEKNEKLAGGLYIIVNQARKSIFEILVPQSPDCKFETESPEYVQNMKVHNSSENNLFYDYLRFSGALYDQVKPLNDELQNMDPDNDSVQLLKDTIQAINGEMNGFKETFMREHPETFLSSFFGLIKEPIFPDTLLTLPDGAKDSLWPFRYYKQHYWDAVDLSDDRLVRTPVFHNKLDTYFDKIISKDADSIFYEIDHLLSQMNELGDMYKFTLWHLTIKFDESQIMGHDAILVKLSDLYFSQGKAPWLHEEVINNIIKEADKRRSTLIGNLAPNMIMQDTNLQPRSMHDLDNDYVVLYFWDPGCGHCKKESPKLVEFYKNYGEKLDVEVFTVCADTNLAEMKKYIRDKKMNFTNVNGPRTYTQDYHDLYNVFTTPIIMVLDKNKRIIAKRLVSDQLVDFIENHKKYSALEESDQ